jgi:Leucine-rich repeat (LRR) protein
MTPDISKLVNLRFLTLYYNHALHAIPDAISCLQKLEEITLEASSVTQLPPGFATLANLTTLRIKRHNGLQFPSNLQVN